MFGHSPTKWEVNGNQTYEMIRKRQYSYFLSAHTCGDSHEEFMSLHRCVLIKKVWRIGLWVLESKQRSRIVSGSPINKKEVTVSHTILGYRCYFHTHKEANPIMRSVVLAISSFLSDSQDTDSWFLIKRLREKEVRGYYEIRDNTKHAW